MRKSIIAAGLGFLAFMGLALSQTISVPLVTNTHLNDIANVIPNGNQINAQNVYASQGQITNAWGYYKSPAAFTGQFLYQFLSNPAPTTMAQFESSSTIAQAYIYLATNPSDGSMNCMYSKSTVTALTLYAGTATPSQTLNDAITAMTAATRYCYLFSASNLTWDRTQ